MIDILNYILWYPSPEIFPNSGINVRWYGLLFASGFIIGQYIINKIYLTEGKTEKDAERLTIYVLVSTVIGARLGHVLFYEPDKYLANPIDILKIWEGGLASHGAAIAIIFGIWLYSKYNVRLGKIGIRLEKHHRKDLSFLWVIDRVVICVALGGALIRTGNFVNSEIIGKPTHTDSGVVFARDAVEAFEYGNKSIEKISFERQKVSSGENVENGVPMTLEIVFKKGIIDESSIKAYALGPLSNYLKNSKYVTEHVYIPKDSTLNFKLSTQRNITTLTADVIGIPRYPAQLFEALSCIVMFIILLAIWIKKKQDTPRGLLLGIFLIIIFGLRFVYEFYKENQVDFEADIPLNMGQWLSIPLVIAGLIFIFRAKK
ncbi:prolipoprotein diacylglyceryl transferase [Aureibacter tunicatorum]|uniref:Phosphatidylglycerol--prolipoprotein diacylglyceryl transferase n=1 Tax=Aureibacter tunicatorum TaxID=866807 RepID=A0AAE3XNH3_9BACT|nr:prolipoprotein diacylglyceryl transferase [Aureibacter tunicatorum]MDR6238309.1 prolipoprotein diacylglyceryl transferase [Aureibacter tunicatorum]BDD03341.1 hypothetical protein AUTU_08240 [Aureibacter tunicatorum]